MKEFLVRLKPVVTDKDAAEAAQKVKEAWDKAAASMQKQGARVSSLIGPSGQDALGSLGSFAKAGFSELGNLSYGLQHFTSGVTMATDVLVKAYRKALDIAEEGAEISNKFVTSSSMFVDSGTKSTMARFGVGAQTAQSYNKAFEVLGISSSDLSTLTSGQREAFDKLVAHYQEGLDSLDPEKLERYNAATQEFQMKQAEFQMDMQLAITELFVNSKSFPQLLDTIEETMSMIVDLLSSDAAQFAFDGFLSFIEGVVKILSLPGKLFGLGDGSTINNNNNNSKTDVQQNFVVNVSDGADIESKVTDLAYKLNPNHGG